MAAKLFAGNWKMNKTLKEAKEFLTELTKLEGDILIFPPFTALAESVKLCKKSKIKIGAQNMHYDDKGAFTGEISPVMLKDIGVTHVLIGHSERRHLFHEDNELLQRKLESAMRHGFSAVYCVGETLAEREHGKTHAVVSAQLEALRGLKDLENVTIAYEPVWAIGTGNNATKEQAQEVHSFIRMHVSHLFSKHAAENVRILYGGSVTPENIKELIAQKDIDGVLVGGSSLDIKKFSAICQS